METSKNVCQECLDFSRTENLETKTFSEILHNKDLQEKKVRTKALFVHDAGYIFLRDLENRKQTAPAGFDKKRFLAVKQKKLCKFAQVMKPGYDSSVEVTIVGYYRKN